MNPKFLTVGIFLFGIFFIGDSFFGGAIAAAAPREVAAVQIDAQPAPDTDSDTNATPARPTGSSNPPTLVDRISLRSGAELTGKILSEKEDPSDGRTYVVIETKSGGLIKLDSARHVRKIRRANAIDAEYLKRQHQLENDPKRYWELYQWCRDQTAGSFRFKAEMKFLLRSIARLDPNDDRSRRRLGYSLVDGQWIFKPALYAAHGYQKDGSSWAPLMQTTVEAQQDERDQIPIERKKQLALWLRNAKQDRNSKADIANQLFQFCDAAAVPIIMDRHARNEQNPRLRMLYVEAFGRVASHQANRYLCYFAIEDPVIDIRERALTLLGQPHFDHDVSARMLSGYLRAGDVTSLKRAAFAVGELGSSSALVPMIDALQTKQTITLPGVEPGRMATTFGNQGTGFQTGGTLETREQVLHNAEVRNALKKLTGEDFGFDEPAWKRWFLENYTLHDIRVRGDD